MALSAGVLQGLIDSNLAADGAKGPKRSSFSRAIARGVVNYLKGKQFNTDDSGNGKGGSGYVKGILQLSSGNMASIAYGVMDRHGPKANSFLNAIMSAVKQHLESDAELKTDNPGVGKGNGKVIIGSFKVTVEGLKGSIEQELISDGAKGPKRSNLSLALATGIVQDILAHGFNVVPISGTNFPPGTSGTGTGTIN